jgi:ATP-binding cassette, subfamily C, bacterial
MPTERPNNIAAALKACRRHFTTAAAFSLALNLLYLAAPLYMMQVYDRVISSSSGMTLAMLTVVTLLAFAALAGLDRARASVLSAASLRLDRLLAGRVFAAMMSEAVRSGNPHQQALRDMDTCRNFVCGHGMTAIFDLPWLPIYILITFGLHPALGVFALISAALLIVLALVSELRVRKISHNAQTSTVATYVWAEKGLRNSHAVRAMTMMPGLLRRWSQDRTRAVGLQHSSAQRTATMGALVRFLRLSMQSLVLGLGAWLVIERATSPGAMFAASLLLGRALQPIEQIIGQWQSMLAARSAFARLGNLLEAHPAPAVIRGAQLMRVEGRLAAEDVSYAVAGRPAPILSGLSFRIEPGESVGLIGPAGAGKSTLVRLMVGALEPSRGVIEIGGLGISRALDLPGGPGIGYMPQEVELFGDTVAANISRFARCPDVEIARAAHMAGAHEMIMRLPQGYRTVIGDGGCVLSGGMRQRIALARAVFGKPCLVVLDEPSSNLDTIGDAALLQCIRHLQSQGTTIVMVSHRRASTAAMHKFLVLIDGRLQAFGTRQEVTARLSMVGGTETPMPPSVTVIKRQGARGQSRQ